MNCPKCMGKTAVLDTRERKTGDVYRRHECLACRHRYTTVERVVKVNGNRHARPQTDVEKAALEIVAIEVGKAKGKHPYFPTDINAIAMIITEEYLELIRAINDRSAKEHIVEEAGHVAATVIRTMEMLLK